MAKTTKLRLIEAEMGEPLKPLIAAKREERVSWVDLARLVSDQSGVPVSDMSLRNWFAEAPSPEAVAS